MYKVTQTVKGLNKVSSKSDNDFLKEARLNSSTRRERPKRRIVPSDVKISRAPQLTQLIDDALSIIGSELAKYSSKSRKGLMLDLKEARAVQGYMDALTKMSREAREASKPDQLEHLSDEQLLEIAKQAIEVESTKKADEAE